MPPNPNPQRTTTPMWNFIERVVALEPSDFVFAGAYTFKTGYHSTVDDNLKNWPGNYSIRLPADLRGPRDKGRAIDIKSKQAASGAKPVIMAKYGARMQAAAKVRDPRVRKWREVLGQFDTDTPPEAIDFQSITERQPDNTHEWHFHWSILTEFVNDPEAYDGMYSVLIGQPLADYQKGTTDMAAVDTNDPSYRNLIYTVSALAQGTDVKADGKPGGPTVNITNVPSQELGLIKAQLSVVNTALQTISQLIQAGGGSIDTAAVLTRMNELAQQELDRDNVLKQENADLRQRLATALAAQ